MWQYGQQHNNDTKPTNHPMQMQTTIARSVHTTGVGLHSGKRVRLSLHPADINTGIVFRRVDLTPIAAIPVTPFAVTDTRLASTLSAALPSTAKVQTVEHLMSACAGLGVDNLQIDVSNEELPILDGSAAAFVYLLQQGGISRQMVPKKYLKILKTVRVEHGFLNTPQHKWAQLSPHEGYSLDFEIGFNHVAVDATPQTCHFEMYNTSRESTISLNANKIAQNYMQLIGRARTFCFTKDVEAMRNQGLALGGGLDNAVVMDDFQVLNPNGLRYADEFVRHKILDAIGDLYLANGLLLAAYTAYKSGHGLNNELLRAVFADASQFEWVTLSNTV